MTHFLALEELLDECVGREVQLLLERGGKEHRAVLRVRAASLARRCRC